MRAKAQIEVDEAEAGDVTAQEALSVVPDPAEDAGMRPQEPEGSEAEPAGESAAADSTVGVSAEPVIEDEPVIDIDQTAPLDVSALLEEDTQMPEQQDSPIVEPEPEREAIPDAAEPLREPEPIVRQAARVLAGRTESTDLGQPDDLIHLRRIIETGRDQRRYVEDLPRRSEKGTYMRLPVHLQDVLAEYCDRNTAPMADFIAALLDSYFRDIGVLPPLGKGHRPNEKVLDKIRKETRTYDY